MTHGGRAFTMVEAVVVLAIFGIVATAAKQLKERGGGRCLISICTAGGMGVVAILER